MITARIFPATLIAALVALNWYVVQRSLDIAPIEPLEKVTDNQTTDRPADREIDAGAEDILLDADASESAFLDRPLFSATRRPRSQLKTAPEAGTTNNETAEPAPVAADKSGLQLIGVMQIGRDDRRVLIRAADAPNGLWLATGGEVGGWRVATINQETVIVAKSGNSEQLILRRD